MVIRTLATAASGLNTRPEMTPTKMMMTFQERSNNAVALGVASFEGAYIVDGNAVAYGDMKATSGTSRAANVTGAYGIGKSKLHDSSMSETDERGTRDNDC